MSTTNAAKKGNGDGNNIWSRFSYSKLTQLQVNGARDRSQRFAERTEWETRLAQAEAQWNQQTIVLSIITTSNDVQSHYGNLLLLAPSCDELADMVESISYKAHRLDTTYARHLHNDHRSVINWLFEEVERNERAKEVVTATLRSKIAQVQNDLKNLSTKWSESTQQVQTEVERLRRLKWEKIREMELQEQVIVKRPSRDEDGEKQEQVIVKRPSRDEAMKSPFHHKQLWKFQDPIATGWRKYWTKRTFGQRRLRVGMVLLRPGRTVSYRVLHYKKWEDFLTGSAST